MLPMPDGFSLVDEMRNSLPLFCYSDKRNTKALEAQGLKLSEKIRLEVIDVHDSFEAGGILCDIRHAGTGNMLVMSITGLNFKENGAIDDKISEYQRARIAWLKQEECRDLRIKLANAANHSALKIARNAPCPCGSGKKYKQCCGAPA